MMKKFFNFLFKNNMSDKKEKIKRNKYFNRRM